MLTGATTTITVISLLLTWGGALQEQSELRPAVIHPKEMVERRFAPSAPEVGEAMPDLPVYDSEGEELRFRDLVRGQHTVVILGCLT